MKAKHHVILSTFLGLTAAIAIFLALDYGVMAQRSAQALEDSCTQHLLQAQERLQAVAIKLGKAPAAGSAAMQVQLLTGASRQADGVVSHLSALPLSHAAMGATIRFCNQVSEYTLGLALQSAGGRGVDGPALQTLKELENQCTLLLGQLATARGQMIAQSLRMMGDESAFYAPAQADVRPLEQVADPDNGMDYPSMIYDGAFSDARHLGTPKALGSQPVDQARAVAIARAFVGEERVQSAQAGVPAGGVIPCHGVRLTLKDGLVLNADITTRGGQVLWMIPEQAAFAPALTLEECAQSGRQFLLAHGYGQMEPNHFQVYDGMAVINFVAVQDGVLLYPDLVKVQLRMDTGEVVGMECNNYLMNHTQRQNLTPTLTREQAQKLASPALAVGDIRLCVIPYRDGEKLCWELCGRYEDNDYRVYLDAHTGEERDVLLMVRQPQGEMAA